VSQENVELVRRHMDAYNRRDVEAMRSLSAPDIVVDWSASRSTLAGVYRGFDEVMRLRSEYFETFQATVVEVDRFIDAGDSVVVPNVAHQVGRDGIAVQARSTLVYAVRDRTVTRVCLYQETDEALKAVGLEEE
jgi:ketosteroid isomerase-like protein